jgi:hypothetical protein
MKVLVVFPTAKTVFFTTFVIMIGLQLKFWMKATPTILSTTTQFPVVIATPATLEQQQKDKNNTVIMGKKKRNTEKEETLSPPVLDLHWNWTSNTNTTTDTIIPYWMKEYFDWHNSIVPHSSLLFNAEHWQSCQFRPPLLILSCTLDQQQQQQQPCGGTADRLKPIPLVLLAAAKSH